MHHAQDLNPVVIRVRHIPQIYDELPPIQFGQQFHPHARKFLNPGANQPAFQAKLNLQLGQFDMDA
jgi:hypothetical protein